MLGEFALADAADVDAAMQAAHAAFPAWRALPVAERARLLRRVGDLMEQRVYDIAAALTLEVGKNRMEALGEAQETVDFFHHYADDFERHAGYEHELPNDPLEGVVSRNRSVMRPYGAWVVIAPFNFPFALAGGPVAAALVTGNTVVFKAASDTPWSGRLLADCMRDAGLPPGVFNYLSGSGREVGEALAQHPLTAGITFTGSVAVGTAAAAADGRRRRIRARASPRWAARIRASSPSTPTSTAPPPASCVRPSAWAGRSARRCRACTCTQSVADELIEKLQQQIAAIRIGDPRRRENWLGPVVNATRLRQLRALRRRS